MAVEMRQVDMREVYPDVNAITPAPRGETMYKGPVTFLKANALAPRFDIAMGSEKGNLPDRALRRPSPGAGVRSLKDMTERLHRNDPHLLEFDATVVARREHEGRPALVLDRTAFYAESGGQPWDTGTLGDARVLAVIEDGPEVLHVLDRPVAGDRVRGRVDANRRRDHMQQHHGQHLLSRTFVELAQAETVAFHLGSEATTIDLDRFVGLEQARAAERRASEIVREARPVRVSTLSAADTPETGYGLVGATVSGASEYVPKGVVIYTETGAIIGAVTASGYDNVTFNDAGVGIVDGEPFRAHAVTYTDTGYGLVGVTASGPGQAVNTAFALHVGVGRVRLLNSLYEVDKLTEYGVDMVTSIKEVDDGRAI